MKVLILGDACIQNKVIFSKKFEKIIENIDLSILNFEGYFGSVTDKNLAVNEVEFLNLAKKLKLGAVSLANNHVNDTKFGLEETKEILLRNKIEYFGTIDKKYYENKKIIILGAIWKLTGGNQNQLNSFNFDTFNILKKIKKLKKFKIFYPHWGVELERFPHPWQIVESKKIIEENIDLICGHHTHLTSIVMNYENRDIIFSLGNFIIKKNQRTYYYPKDSTIGQAILVDVEKKQIKYFKTFFNEFADSIDIEESEPEILKMNYKEYKKFFLKNRTKKNLPVFDENTLKNKIKSSYNLILIKIFEIEIMRIFWKKFKNIRGKNGKS